MVIGVRWKEDFKGARYTVVEKPEDLVLLKGSKYVDVDRSIHWNGEIRSIYSIVGDYLNSGKKVLFIGLGCDVYAVKSFVKRKAICDDGLYTIDLLCGGTTPRNVMEQYVSWLEDKFKSTLKDFSVRYKKYGWTPMYLRACFKNGKVFTIPFFHSEYGYAFNHMKKESCYNCKYRGTNHLSDITLGDFWGCNHNSESYNSMGMSSIIVSGEKGYELLNIINKKIFRVAEADLEQVFKGDIYFGSSVVKDNKYQRYKQIYDKHGIFEAMKASTGVLKYHLLKSWIMSVKEIIDVRFRK